MGLEENPYQLLDDPVYQAGYINGIIPSSTAVTSTTVRGGNCLTLAARRNQNKENQQPTVPDCSL